MDLAKQPWPALLALVLALSPDLDAKAESAGLKIDFIAESRGAEANHRLQAGEPLRVGFRIADRTGRFPLGDLHPGAWIRRASDGRPFCEQAVRRYLRQGANAGADLDLNGYAFVTLNADQTLAVLDPRLDLGSSNLLSLTRLEAEVADWRLDETSGRLFLALPDLDQIAAVDLFSGRIAGRWPTAKRPARLAALPGASDFWVAAEEGGALLRLDARTGESLQSLDLAKGPIRLAVDEEDRRLFALDSGGRLLVVDGISGAVMDERRIEGGGADLLYSPKADAIAIARGGAEALSLVYLDQAAAPIAITLPAGADQIAADPKGRWLFALDVETGRLSIVDLALNRATHVLDFAGRPDRMATSEDYLYLRETEAARVSLLHLASLANDRAPGVLDVALGAEPTGPAESALTLPTIAALPEGGGALIAHPMDKTLYLYRETGMQAPSNAFRSWTAPPAAVLIHDRSLKESAAGLYETTAVIERPGAYEVVFHLANPGHVACFPIEVEGDRGDVASDQGVDRPPMVTAEVDGSLDGERPIAITLELRDPSSQAPIRGVRDLKVLIVDRVNGWHWQGFAAPIEKDGAYAVRLRPPKPGAYALFARSKSAGLSFDDQRRLTFTLE
jgi:hypothetical protein